VDVDGREPAAAEELDTAAVVVATADEEDSTVASASVGEAALKAVAPSFRVACGCAMVVMMVTKARKRAIQSHEVHARDK